MLPRISIHLALVRSIYSGFKNDDVSLKFEIDYRTFSIYFEFLYIPLMKVLTLTRLYYNLLLIKVSIEIADIEC